MELLHLSTGTAPKSYSESIIDKDIHLPYIIIMCHNMKTPFIFCNVEQNVKTRMSTFQGMHMLPENIAKCDYKERVTT